MKKLSLLFSLLVIVLSSHAQNRKLDSLYQLLNTHPEEDSLRAKLLYNICFFEKQRDLEKCKTLATEALRISKEINFTKGMGWAHKYLAGYYRESGDYGQASKHAFEMLNIFEGTSNAKGLGQSYQLLGIINQEAKNPEKAQMYYLKATEVFQKAGLQLDLSFIYNSLGALNMDLKNYDEALKYQFKSLEIRKALNYEDDLFMYANIATSYKLSGNYKMSLEYFQKELPKMESSSSKNGRAIAYIELGDLYTLMGNYARANDCLLKAVAIARSFHHKRILSIAYEKFTDLEKVRKNYLSALTYQELSAQYKDSIFSEDKAKRMAELEIRYQSEQKDQKIQALEQQRQIQNLKQWFILAGLLILVAIFITIFFLQRSHNKRVRSLLEVQKSLNSKLHDSDKLKSKFFANISHELRTPLTLILAPIDEKLSMARLNPSDRKAFQLIRRNAFRLLTLINQLLDLSKLEAKKMELTIQSGDLKKFIGILAASFDSLAEHREIHFRKNIQINASENWYDADKLEKIINNLLSNAIKFTRADGEVTLSVTQSLISHIDIKITDTGKGISPDEQEHIFSPFYQSRFREDEGQPGTGLGLSLVKELVSLYGGTLKLTSKENEGTSVFITLPVVKEQFPSSAIDQPLQPMESNDVNLKLISSIERDWNEDKDDRTNESVSSESVLIVEDNQDLREYIYSVLKDEYHTLVARDGEEGFELAAEHIPSLVISDVMMPNVNGIQLTDRIKSDERTSHIPVVLLTAKADDESKIEGLQTGADDYLAKPFSIPELKIRISNLIVQRKKLAAKYRTAFAIPISAPLVPQELSLDEKFLTKARHIVETHIGDNGFGVEQMASEVHLSRAQLFRKLKAIANLSPNEFINEIRLQKAAELIRLRADGLTQISYRVGYSEQSYFAKRFRKKFGVTPSEYQAKHSKIK
jgi:signal transduction histidine kinase/DNA-binding response OmpR family regulator